MAINTVTIARHRIVNVRALLKEARNSHLIPYAKRFAGRTIIENATVRRNVIRHDVAIATIDKALGDRPRLPQSYR